LSISSQVEALGTTGDCKSKSKEGGGKGGGDGGEVAVTTLVRERLHSAAKSRLWADISKLEQWRPFSMLGPDSEDTCSNTLQRMGYLHALPGHLASFLFKIRAGVLPVAREMVRRKLLSDPLCGVCGKEEEDLAHFLGGCEVLHAGADGTKEGYEDLAVSEGWARRSVPHHTVECLSSLYIVWGRRNTIIHSSETLNPNVVNSGPRAYGDAMAWLNPTI